MDENKEQNEVKKEVAPSVFDLAALDQNDTTTITINHPVTGDPIPGVTAVVYGQDSDLYRAEARKVDSKFINYSRQHRGNVMPAEEREELDRAKYAKCCKITGFTYKGEVLTDAKDIFNRFPWVYEQITQAVMDRAGFIKGSSAK